MLDIEIIKIKLKKFVERHDFLEEIEENSQRIDQEEDYKKIDRKYYIKIIYERTLPCQYIEFGRIEIIKEDIDEEEWTWIDYDRFFIINIKEFETEELLIEEIITKCISFDMITNR
jgi:hypothetical protein